MTKYKFIWILIVGLSVADTASAQQQGKDAQEKPNIVKVNLTSLALKNYGLQYERILSKPLSVAISGRIMPETGIPFKSFISKQLPSDDETVQQMLNQGVVSNYAVTPELKWYVGKGYGEGFYISIFYRFSQFNADGIPVDYEAETGPDKTLNMAASLTSHTGGILFGLQKTIGKVVALDFWFLGPHAGKGTGNFTGTPNVPLTAYEQQQLRESLEEIEIPFLNKGISVDANKASLSLDGPWAGIRAGISVGIRF